MFVLGTPFMMFAEIPWMDTRAVHTSAGRVGGDEEVELVAAGVAQQLALGPVRPPIAPAHRRARPGRKGGQSSFLTDVFKRMRLIHSLFIGQNSADKRDSKLFPGVLRAVGVVARADAAVVAVAAGAVGARLVAAPLQLHAAGEVHW